MEEIILDFTNLTKEDVESGDLWVDSPERSKIETILLDYIGKKIRVKITGVREHV